MPAEPVRGRIVCHITATGSAPWQPTESGHCVMKLAMSTCKFPYEWMGRWAEPVSERLATCIAADRRYFL